MDSHICDMQQGKLKPLLTPCHIPSPPKKNRDNFNLIMNTKRHYIPEIMKFKETIFSHFKPHGKILIFIDG